MDVVLSVDVEFDIAGTFADPSKRAPIGPQHVSPLINGKDEGLGFILRTLREFQHKAVFFIEAANVCYFGHGPMGEIAAAIAAEGHDVELHLHPVWTYFSRPDWPRSLLTLRPHDSVPGLNSEELRRLLEVGMEAFVRWNLPSPIAARTGSLCVNLQWYEVLREFTIPLSSSIGFGYMPPPAPIPPLFAGLHRISDILEVPVTSYSSPCLSQNGRGWRIMTIVGSGTRELIRILQWTSHHNFGPVVALTHPHEYVHWTPGHPRHHIQNRLSRRRLVNLCRFLSANAAGLRLTTFRDSLPRLRTAADTTNPVIRTPVGAAITRMLANSMSNLHRRLFLWGQRARH